MEWIGAISIASFRLRLQRLMKNSQFKGYSELEEHVLSHWQEMNQNSMQCLCWLTCFCKITKDPTYKTSLSDFLARKRITSSKRRFRPSISLHGTCAHVASRMATSVRSTAWVSPVQAFLLGSSFQKYSLGPLSTRTLARRRHGFMRSVTQLTV